MSQDNIHTNKRVKETNSIAKNTRVLLVEDNRINQAIMLGVLKNMGISADIAGNGKEALMTLLSTDDDKPYQLIIMDCHMPEMDGYEATTAIREGKAKPVHCNVPIIAMTANDTQDARDKCLDIGMNEYTTKPVDAEVIHEKIVNCLGIDLVSSKENNCVYRNSNEDKSSVWQKDEFLKRIRNNNMLSQKLIAMFIDEMPSLLSQLNSAIESEVFDDILALAHKMTGSSRNIGGHSVAKLTKNIEQLARRQDCSELMSLQKALSSEFDLLIEVLQHFLLASHNTEQNINKD